MPTLAYHQYTFGFILSYETTIRHIYCAIIVAEGMAQVFQGLQGVIVFIDDILVMGRTREEHTRNLLNVLDRLRQAGLHLRKSKCLFFQQSLEYVPGSCNFKGRN